MCIKKTLFEKLDHLIQKLGMIGDNLGLGEEPDFFIN